MASGPIKYEENVTESWVWKQFAKKWNGYAERHEPGIGAGDPDVWVLPLRANRNRPLSMAMIELKAPSKIDLRPAQWTWHERWQRMGGFVPVVTCDRYAHNITRWMAYAPTFDKRRELIPMLSSSQEWPTFQAKLYRILNLFP